MKKRRWIKPHVRPVTCKAVEIITYHPDGSRTHTFTDVIFLPVHPSEHHKIKPTNIPRIKFNWELPDPKDGGLYKCD